MARTKQIARKSAGGKAPRKQLATKVHLYLNILFAFVSMEYSSFQIYFPYMRLLFKKNYG